MLEMIYCQKIKQFEEVQQFVSCTLMSVQQPGPDVTTWTLEALEFLKQHQFLLQYKNLSLQNSTCILPCTSIPSSAPAASTLTLTTNERGHQGHQGGLGGQGGCQAGVGGGEDSSLLAASPLGRATTLSGISPKDAVLVGDREVMGCEVEACMRTALSRYYAHNPTTYLPACLPNCLHVTLCRCVSVNLCQSIPISAGVEFPTAGAPEADSPIWFSCHLPRDPALYAHPALVGQL